MNVHGCLLNKQYMQEKHLIHNVHAMVQFIVVQYIRLHLVSQDFFCVSFVMFAQSTFCIFEHLAFVTTNNRMFDCGYQQVLLRCSKELFVYSTLIQFLDKVNSEALFVSQTCFFRNISYLSFFKFWHLNWRISGTVLSNKSEERLSASPYLFPPSVLIAQVDFHWREFLEILSVLRLVP